MRFSRILFTCAYSAVSFMKSVNSFQLYANHSKIVIVCRIYLMIATEFFRYFFLMPFSVSQSLNGVEVSYFFYHNLWLLRIVGLVMILYPSMYIFIKTKRWQKIVLASCIITYAVVAYSFEVYWNPVHKYAPLLTKTFSQSTIGLMNFDKPVIGVSINGETKAYPLQLIAYHHIVNDTFGNKPVIVTYCTLCRSARVYSSVVNETSTLFRIVGLGNYNALLEDSLTHSFWQQETGKAVAGPMKGHVLAEIPFLQTEETSWMQLHPQTKILQPDSHYFQQYALMNYQDEFLERPGAKKDSNAYNASAIVVAVADKHAAKTYDWYKLRNKKVIEDSLPGIPLLITVESNNVSYHVLERSIANETLQFKKVDNEKLQDINTSSLWNMQGKCVEGELQGTQLEEVQSYQENRASWNEFHPASQEYDMNGH